MMAAAQNKPASTAVPCASATHAPMVRDFYENQKPGRPLPVASRHFNVAETVIASALPATQSIGTAGSAQVAQTVWKSIDEWGANTSIKLVLTSGGKHAYSFPSLVPMAKPDTGEGWLDMYADDSKGVHAHINGQYLKAVFATDLPGPKAGERTQAISFYNQDGSLVLGVYARVAGETFDQAAVEGFKKTWAVIESLPRICAAK
ncbi:ChuX/HutX family heme-like substrate-binding protein [Steroidobacter sp.]|uniref:ChuX/HutX family heme-like substrate-binding protein n=1 Tax=Steroidobacter sp. TaxID=1978227 RepID=UPI0025D3DBA1|nr:ChuX/HutX family heme-like substrate-binding protein [Steroidobacter sp.]